MKPAAWVSTTRTAPGACPVCRRRLDAATGVQIGPDAPAGPVTPAPGDVTGCAYCGSILVFAAGGGFTVADQAAIDQLDPVLRDLLAAWRPRGAR